jgi:2-polyprenyl-3-methyl-5-hydroxy-6-metoxy-1,4-benzoquinol methylase
MMEQSLEHIIPDELPQNETTGSETLLLHINRYRFASTHITDGITLDFACGSGYGSHLMVTESDKNINVIAADKNPDIIKYAVNRYSHPNISFIVSDDEQIISLVPDLNNIVCLETIEHLPNPKSFIEKISDNLIKGGRFIASVPVTFSTDANPFHLHDFTIRQFKSLFHKNQFRQLDELIQVQPFSFKTVFLKKEKRMVSIRKNLFRYYLKHPDLFFKRLASLFTHGFTNKYYTAVFEKCSD